MLLCCVGGKKKDSKTLSNFVLLTRVARLVAGYLPDVGKLRGLF